MEVYRVRNWDSQFENNRTRSMKNMMWVPVPNKHDGDGYTELVDHENGAAHLGAWLVILQVASKCAVRGTLLRDNGTPHTATTLARVSRISKGIICEAIARLSSGNIGWLEVLDIEDVTTIWQEGAGNPQEGAPITHPTDEEGKGMEEKELKGIKTPSVSEQFDALPDGEVKNALKLLMDYRAENKTMFTATSFLSFLETMRREYADRSESAFVDDVAECLNKGWKNFVFPSQRGRR